MPRPHPQSRRSLWDNGFPDQHSWRSAHAATAPDTRPPRPLGSGAAPSPLESGRGPPARQLRCRVPWEVGGAADRTERATRPVTRSLSVWELDPHLEVLLESDGEDLRHGVRGAEKAAATAPLVWADRRTGRRTNPLTRGSSNRSIGSRSAGALPGPHCTYPPPRENARDPSARLPRVREK